MATPAVGCAVSTIFGRNIVVRNSVMAVAWYLVTNQCPPHLYGMQLSRAHVVPRTMREGCSSVTSTSWADTLDHPDAAPGEVRLASFRALCEPCLSGDDASRAARLPVRDGGGGHSGSCGGDGRRDGD